MEQEQPIEGTKKCPFCAEEIKSEAKICKYCGKDLENFENQEKVKQGIFKLCKHCKTAIDKKAKKCPNCGKKQGMGILGTIIVLCICLWFFGFMMQDLGIVDNQNNVNIEEKIPTWTYQDKIDEMDSKVTHFAILSSTNKAYFSFPYSGGSTFILNIRNNGKNEVLLRVSKGQFSSNYGKTIKIKFDDLEPFTVNFNEPSDGSSDLVFLGSAEKIINGIKTAKIMKIEAEFFQEGEHIAEFLVEGLEWNY